MQHAVLVGLGLLLLLGCSPAPPAEPDVAAKLAAPLVPEGATEEQITDVATWVCTARLLLNLDEFLIGS